MPYQITTSTTNQVPYKVIITVNNVTANNSDLSLFNQEISKLLACHLNAYVNTPSLCLTLELNDVVDADLNIDELIERLASMPNIVSFSVTPLPKDSTKIRALLIHGTLFAVRNKIFKIAHNYLKECTGHLERIQNKENSAEKKAHKQKTPSYYESIDPSFLKEDIKSTQSATDVNKKIQQEWSSFELEINAYCVKFIHQLMSELDSGSQEYLLNRLFISINQFLCKAETILRQIEELFIHDISRDESAQNCLSQFSLVSLAHPDFEMDPILLKYMKYLNSDKRKIAYLPFKQLRLVNYIGHCHKSKSVQKSSPHNIWSYQEIAVDDSLNKTKTFIKNSLQSYSHLFNIGDDRKKAVKQLQEDVKESKDLTSIVTLFNTEFDNSIHQDYKYNLNKSSLFHRSAVSRFRQNLLSCKMWLFTICPPSKLSVMIRTENLYLPVILNSELRRGCDYYENHPELKKLINELIRSCQSDTLSIERQNHSLEDDQSTLLLAKKLAYLERMRNHTDYDSKKCGLSGIYQCLSVLFHRAKIFLPSEQQYHFKTCKSINKLLSKMTINAPSIFCLFSDAYYTIPANNEFNQLLHNIHNAKLRFYLYQTMSTINKHLNQKYGAKNINIIYTNVTSTQLAINLDILDSQTKQRNRCPALIHIDQKQTKYVVEPMLTLNQNTQDKQNKMVASK